MISIAELYSVFLKHPIISTDTRTILPASMFFALKGPAFNGNQFAEKALAAGAAFVVIDEVEFKKDDRFLLVEDVLTTLQELANYHRQHLQIPFLAITGSNGKTTTKELIRAVLAKKYKTHATKGNLNNHIGVPLTILSITPDAEFAVIEMGANHQKEIESYCKIAEPDFGLITNVGKAHLEGFGGFEGVKKGKGELYSWISVNGKMIFINGDNNHLKEMSGGIINEKKIFYGTADYFYCFGKLLKEESFLNITWTSEDRSGLIESQIIGGYNFENILSAVCIGNYFGVKAADIDDAVSAYVSDNSRSQIVKAGTNTIILDAYNANPTSMEAALNNFGKINSDQKYIFIGDMAELGEESREEHKKIIELLKKMKPTTVVLVGKNFGEFESEIFCLHFIDSEKAAEWVSGNAFENATVLIKGSRSSKMEKVFDAIQGI